MHARARMMSEVEEVQEQMKADMEAIKDQMAAMMEAMLSMKKIIESNTVVVSTTSTVTEVDPTHPSGINQISCPIPDVVGVTTYPSAGGAKRPKRLSPREKTSRVATNFYSRKTLEKPKRGLWILKNEGSTVVYARGRY